MFFLAPLCNSFWEASDPDVICCLYFSGLLLSPNPAASPFFSPLLASFWRGRTDVLTVWPLLPVPSKKCFLCFQLWSLSNWIFQAEALRKLQQLPGHPWILPLYCLPRFTCGLFSFCSSPWSFWPSNPNPFFPLSALSLHLFLHSFLLDSCCISKSSSSKTELPLLLPKMPSLACRCITVSPVFSATIKLGISLDIFHFILLLTFTKSFCLF